MWDSGGAEIPGADFQWTSRNPEVATVADGVVTAVGDGWTVVTATAQGMSADAPIVVVTPEGPTDRMDCIACHIDAYLGRHGASDTPQTCLQCHSGPTWTGATVDHPAVANGFELLGAHATLSCAACHAADGTGKNWIGTFLQPHPRDLTDSDFMTGMSVERLSHVIRDGLPGTSMPAWKSVLTDTQIDAVVRYIHRAFHPLSGVDG